MSPAILFTTTSPTKMWNTLQGALALNKAKDYVSDAGIKIPGITSKHDDDAKNIDAKIAMKKAAMEKARAIE